MAFTDPIIAGEELTRQALKSDNYIPGVSGWRIARDGAAEFDNLGIRGALWAPQIFLGGQDLDTRLTKMPRGVLAWMGGYPTTQTTTEAQIMATEVQVIAGRWYEISLINITPDVGNTKATEFRLRRSTDGSAVTNSSPIMAISLRLSQFELGNIRATYGAPSTGTLKLRASISSLDGANVRSWAPGDGCIFYVYDMGVMPPPTGTSGVGVPVRVLKEFTITATSSRTYLGTGALRTDSPYDKTMIMGDWSNGKGNQRAWCSFSASDVATYLDDLVNVPASDIVTAELKLRAIGQWKNVDNTGIVSLGFHNTSGPLPASNELGGGIPNVCRYTLNGYDPFWFDLKTGGGGGGVPSNFLDSMRDGYLNGFMVGNTFSGNSYCGILAGATYPDPAYNTPPQLHMKYYKLQ
jgi:hypothetical protein